MMPYATVFRVLEELQLEQYQDLFTANLLDDEVLIDLYNSGILTEHLKEIVPPLAHRLLILKRFNESKVFTEDTGAEVQVEADVHTIARLKPDTTPEVFAIGSKEEIIFEEVFVISKGKAIKCHTLLEAIDFACKSFYIFCMEFPTNSYGAYHFLDYCIYKMKANSTVLSKVKELSAFVEPHPNE